MSRATEKDAVFQIMGGIEHPVIVELGAHIGEEFSWMYKMKPCSYVMVEPDPVNCQYLLPYIQGNNNVGLVIGAIAKQDGEMEFYPAVNHASKNRASGSTKNPTGHLKHFPEVEFGAAYRVAAWTLDTICKDHNHIDLLWCDIQGAERDMIEGGRATLAKTRYMMIEAEPEVELYEGQALKPELIAMLPDWEIIKDFGYNLLMRNTKYAV